jgi:tRNA-dihydrouridine synthase
MENFWQQLKQTQPQSIVGLAPMDGITDQPFRFITQKYGQPDVIFTEFVNVEGLCHNAERLLEPLLYDVSQRPIVAQIYGKTPDSFRQAAILVCQLGFDGIDLNMGCPSKSVAGGGSGAALIKTPQLATAIIQATQQGIQEWLNGATCADCSDFSAEFCKLVELRRQTVGLPLMTELKTRTEIPLSVKTRTGFDQPSIDSWLSTILATQPEALILHGRTYKQSFRGPADWSLISQAAELVRQLSPETIFLGNGDVKNRADGEAKARQHQLDGVLIGRAVRGNPWVFTTTNPLLTLTEPQRFQKMAQLALEHAQVFEQTFSQREKFSFLPMRKHLAWHMSGFPGAKQLRQQLVRANSSQEVAQIFKQFDLLT